MAYQSLDLTLDPSSDHAIRGCWDAVAALGVPSEGGRTSASHRPHLTLFAAPAIGPDQVDLAVNELRPLLPLLLALGAGVVFGNGPFVAAHLVVVPPSLGLLEERLRQQHGEQPDRPERLGHAWIAHLTLSKRVSIHRLGAVMETIGQHRPDFVVIDHLRHWDPMCRTVTRLL